MRALDMDAVRAHKVSFTRLDWRAACFWAAYMSLIRVLQTSAPYDTPPHQVTVSANPNFSKESDSSMGSSSFCDFKPGPFTDMFLDQFVTGVLCSIEDELAVPIPWLRQNDRFYLSMGYDLVLLR
jgi:hypothetical protein